MANTNYSKEEILTIYRERKRILQEQIARGEPFFGGEKTIAGWKKSVAECNHLIECVENDDYTVTVDGKIKVPTLV